VRAAWGLGALIGVLLARGTPWSAGSLLGAHLALNLGGWLGMAIVGTLHTFFPSLTQTRLRSPALQGPTFVLWLLGVAQLTFGAAFGTQVLVASGWLSLALATCLLAINLGASLHAARRTLTLPAQLIALAQAFLAAGLLFALAVTISNGPREALLGDQRNVLAVLLLAGWIGLTVSGALLHLLAVLARVRSFSRAMPTPAPVRDPALTLAAGVGISALALSHVPSLDALGGPASIILLTVLALLSVRVLVLAVRALRLPVGARS
jgi:nitrite reductase (NO-forming)